MSQRSCDFPQLRICILADSFYPIVGGGEAHARLLSAELVRRDVAVLVLTRRRLRKFAVRETIDGVEVVRVLPYGFQRFGKYLMIVPAILRLLVVRNQYDIIYVCGLRVLGAIGVLAGRLLGKKTILRAESCGEMSGDFVYASLDRTKGKVISAVIDRIINVRNKVLRGADCFLAISNVIKEEFKSAGVDAHMIVSIPNGINTTRYCPVRKEEKNRLRKTLGIPEKTIFVYTGKLNKGKGLELLLKVWARVVGRCDCVHLYLVGSGQYQALGCENELRCFVAEHRLETHVTFTGYVENVHEYLQAADYFLLPSESEAHPLSLIEAMSCGLPTISTAVGGMLDIVEDGVNGRLVELGDDKALEDGILEFIGHPEASKQLGIKARASVVERYGIGKIADDHIGLFNRLCFPT